MKIREEGSKQFRPCQAPENVGVKQKTHPFVVESFFSGSKTSFSCLLMMEIDGDDEVEDGTSAKCFNTDDGAASTEAFCRNKKRFFSRSKASFSCCKQTQADDGSDGDDEVEDGVSAKCFRYGRRGGEHERFLQEQEAFLQLLQGFIFPASEQSDDGSDRG
jgi:hypothetical protein